MKIGRLLLGSLFALALSCWVSAGIEVPELKVQKDTNGSDADSAPGPTIACGDLITWTYVVTNKAGDYIDIIGLTDSELGPITCAGLASRLLPGESVTCTAVGFAVEGQYVNTPTVTGELGEGQDPVEDTDDSHYLGVCPTLTPPTTPTSTSTSSPTPTVTTTQTSTSTSTATSTQTSTSTSTSTPTATATTTNASTPMATATSTTGTPQINVTPRPYDFGAVIVHSSATQTFTISNVGSSALMVTAVTLVGPDAGEFSIDGFSGPAPPFSLSPGQSNR